MQERAALIWNGLLDIVYPPICLVCGTRQEMGALCEPCQQEIKPLSPPFCDRCGTSVPADALVCEACAAGPEPPFAWSQALGVYQGSLSRAIQRLKYDRKTALAQPLGHLLAESLKPQNTPLLTSTPAGQPCFDAVVPVPLHPAKLRQRGFNQSERIARVLAQECNWKLDTVGLRRVRQTQSQTRLSNSARAANVENAFAARSPQHFAGQSVLLLDDVLTTMATIREAARVIKDAGARRVCIVALAKTM